MTKKKKKREAPQYNRWFKKLLARTKNKPLNIKQIEKVLGRDYRQFKLHVYPDPWDKDRFCFHKNYLFFFGMDKYISPEEMERQIKDNFLNCLFTLKNRITSEVFEIISGGWDFELKDLRKMAENTLEYQDKETKPSDIDVT